MPSYYPWAFIALVAILAVSLWRFVLLTMKISRLKKIMPPGPPGLPLLGNMLQVGSFQWFKFTEWKEQYGMYNYGPNMLMRSNLTYMSGPIFSINLAGQPIVVLNDFATAGDLIGEYIRVLLLHISYILCRTAFQHLQ